MVETVMLGRFWEKLMGVSISDGASSMREKEGSCLTQCQVSKTNKQKKKKQKQQKEGLSLNPMPPILEDED